MEALETLYINRDKGLELDYTCETMPSVRYNAMLLHCTCQISCDFLCDMRDVCGVGLSMRCLGHVGLSMRCLWCGLKHEMFVVWA